MGDSAPAPPASLPPGYTATRRTGAARRRWGDGAQLRVTRNRHLIGYCLSPDDLPALGVDMSHMAHPLVSGAGRPGWRERLATAQLKVASLEYRAGEYARQRDEAQILLDDTLAKLEDARAWLKKVEAE